MGDHGISGESRFEWRITAYVWGTHNETFIFLHKIKNDTIKNLKGYVELDLVCIYNRNTIAALSMCNFWCYNVLKLKINKILKFTKDIQATYSLLLCTHKDYPFLNKGLQICFSVIYMTGY